MRRILFQLLAWLTVGSVLVYLRCESWVKSKMRVFRWVWLWPLVIFLILCWLYEEWKDERRVYYKRPETRLDRVIQRAGYWWSRIASKKSKQPNPAGRTGSFLHRKAQL